MKLGAALLALTLAACAAPEPGRCDVAVTREIAFTGADARDTLSARSFGASCAQAIGVIAIATEDGAPIWAWAAPLARHFGEDFIEPGPEAMHAFLERWSHVEITSTAAAPEWRLLAPGQTSLDRLTYDDIRARDLPMLCHYAETARQICVFWEPAAGAAGRFVDRDYNEEEPAP